MVDREMFPIVFPLEVFERKERVVDVLVTGVRHTRERHRTRTDTRDEN